MFAVPSLDVSAALKTLVLTLDLLGTFVFALSGAVAGVRRRLDLFGILVLSFVAANSGGIVRDLLIGATPPAAIADWRYLAVSLLAGVLIFFWYPSIKRLRSPVLIFDAAGLALFCVAGAQKALVFGLEPVMAALLGMLTGVGGGVARDVLLSEIPAVLRSDVYAVAALAGAGVVVAGAALDLPSTAQRRQVVLVADLVHPHHVDAVQRFLDRDVGHRRGGVAPCQCLWPGGHQITSPARISTLASPSHWVQPQPAVTIRVWPSGWVCQAERAPGSKVTLAHETRAGAGGAFRGSMRTVPVKYSSGPLHRGLGALRVSVPWKVAR
jgi:uncharacterized membrane protein YeiH